MIKLIESPQRADVVSKYVVENDTLIVELDGVIETFDFTGLSEGYAEEIAVDILPLNPIVSASKAGDEVTINVIRFYNADEKGEFEWEK